MHSIRVYTATPCDPVDQKVTEDPKARTVIFCYNLPRLSPVTEMKMFRAVVCHGLLEADALNFPDAPSYPRVLCLWKLSMLSHQPSYPQPLTTIFIIKFPFKIGYSHCMRYMQVIDTYLGTHSCHICPCQAIEADPGSLQQTTFDRKRAIAVPHSSMSRYMYLLIIAKTEDVRNGGYVFTFSDGGTV